MNTLFQPPRPDSVRPPRRRPAPAARAAPTPSHRPRSSATQVVALLLEPLPLWLAQRQDPTLARTPAAVVHEGRVLHANPPARRLGVSRGMRLEGAKLRAQHLVTLAPSPVDLARAWHGVLRELAAWTPWLTSHRQGLALLRATPLEAAELAEAFEGRVGVAADRQTAELAAAAARPGAVRNVPPGAESAFLARLPLRFLRAAGLGEGDLTRLQWLGLATAGDLARWSREQLEGYLGAAGRALGPYLHGPRSSELPSWAPPAPLRRHLAFDQPLFEPFELEGAIDHLSRALAEALAGSAAKRLTLIAEVGALAMPASRLAKRPMRAPEQIRRQALLALDDCGAAPIGIDGLALELDERARCTEQEGLWATRAQRVRAEETVLARFPDALRQVRWGDPYAPAVDHAWAWEPVSAASAGASADDAAGEARPDAARASASSGAAPASAAARGTTTSDPAHPRRDDAVPLFAGAGAEQPTPIVLHPPATAAAPVRTAPARPRVDLAALELERAERWPGERGRLTNRVLRAA